MTSRPAATSYPSGRRVRAHTDLGPDSPQSAGPAWRRLPTDVDHPRFEYERRGVCNLFVVCEPPRDPGPPGTVAWHLARLLGRTVAQIGLEDRLLAHGEDLVAVPLLEQPGTDHAST